MLKDLRFALLALALLTVWGCARQITSENPDAPNREAIAAFTPEDIEKAVQIWMEDIMLFGPVATAAQPPLVGYCGILNMGRDHIEMDEFERAFKYWGLRSGKIRFTSATDLPAQFFEQHKFQKSLVADPATAVQIGKMQGWRYSLYGKLFSQSERNARGDRILYYDVYIYMLDIQTGEEVWNSRKKFKLRDTKPGVGY